mmetsp:Transcript_53612/g.128546  ORF Transcript_53612/g.128546 Transcript_53612/m.128546 type:complete len:138 (-) Transcript_53612:97-510(-)
MVAPWLGAAAVLHPGSIAMAVPSTAWDDHTRWIRDMNQEYARRLSMAAETSSVDLGSGGGRTGYEVDTGFEEVLDDEVHVYRSIGLGGRAGMLAAGGLPLQPAFQSTAQWATTHAEVDEEWKRTFPPMLRRQAAFRP